jgi:pyruvate,water dikinase
MDSLAERNVVWLREIGVEHISIAGGKGANLGELTQTGAPVPNAWVATAHAHAAFLKSLPKPIIDKMIALNDADRANATDFSARVEEIKTSIEEHELPLELRSQFLRSYEQMKKADGTPEVVAVRSAARPEDGADASFAGQQGTFTDIRGGENVLHAITACWATCYELRSVTYRMELRELTLERAAAEFDEVRKRELLEFADSLRHENFSMAVVVQTMIQSYVSGVMLMVDAATSDPEFITVQAVFGLGAGVVDGTMEADTFKFRKDEELTLTEHIHVDQPEMYIRNPDSTGSIKDATIKVASPSYLVHAPKLTRGQARAIARYGMDIEQHYGAPQDIEWAAVQERTDWLDFFILQTRPITVKPILFSGTPAPTESSLLGTGAAASPGVGVGRIRIVTGDPGKDTSILDRVQPGDILVTEMTTPDWVPAMKRAAAIVTLQGSVTCHAAIVSREKGIPCIVAVHNALELPDGALVTVNSATGQIWLGECPNTIAWWEAEVEYMKKMAANVETVTHVCINGASPEDVRKALNEGKRPAGNTLARAEFFYIDVFNQHPRALLDDGKRAEVVQVMTDGFTEHAQLMWPNTVTVRNDDLKPHELGKLGGGRGWDYEKPNMSENPQDGYRGVARYLDRTNPGEQEVFHMEVEAIAKTYLAGYTNIQLMLPYVRVVDELKECLALIDSFLEPLGVKRGKDGLRVIMMVELPENVLNLDAYIDAGIDGISVGSNDLGSKTHGLDRDWKGRAKYADIEVGPSMFKLYQMTGETAYRRGLAYIGFCGQGVALFPELAGKLVGWHFTHIGTSPDSFEAALINTYNAELKLGIRAKKAH